MKRTEQTEQIVDLIDAYSEHIAAQIAALIDAYIEVCENDGYDDAQIIDTLADIFNRDELREYGFGDFVKDYFDDGDAVGNPGWLFGRNE